MSSSKSRLVSVTDANQTVSSIRFRGPNSKAEPESNRRADLLGIKLFAFNFTALEHVGSECLQDSFLAKTKAQSFHATGQSSLTVTHGGKRFGEKFAIARKLRPLGQFINVHSPHLMRRL